MKAMKRIGALLLALGLLASLNGAAFAEDNAYTPVEGTSCSFNKFLIMDAGDKVPTVSFSFTVEPGTARSPDTSSNDVMEVYAGVGAPTIADVSFGPSDSTQTSVGSYIDVGRTAAQRQTGLDASTGVQFETGEKFAVKTATVSFSGISFSEPGIYRYIITETANSAHGSAGIMHDNDTDRVLDVYVTDDGTGTLAVSAYVLHTEDEDVPISTTMGSNPSATLDDKTDGFTNEYNSKDLAFKKEVTGNQASRDKWFEFTVTLGNVNDADEYVVSLAADDDANTTDGNASATSGTNGATREANRNKTNPTSVTGAQLKAGVKFYLQDGQSVAIRGIAPNATYSVTEDAEDYSSTASAVSGYTDATSGTVGTVAGTNKAVKTSFKNQREGVVPTGVMLTVLPGVVIVVLALVLLGVLLHKKKES